jgi:hypothetical protein
MNAGAEVYYLKEADEGHSRLIVRQRLSYSPGLANHLMWHLVEPLNFVMERRMLRGIKDRVEGVGFRRTVRA